MARTGQDMQTGYSLGSQKNPSADLKKNEHGPAQFCTKTDMSMFILSSVLHGMGSFQGNIVRINMAIKQASQNTSGGETGESFFCRGDFVSHFLPRGQDFTSIGPLGFSGKNFGR